MPMESGETTHGHEFGLSEASKRGPTKLFEHDATHLLLHQLIEVAQTFATCGEAIWGFGFNPVEMPMLFVSRSPGSGELYGICCGPVDRDRFGLIAKGEFGDIIDQRPPARRRDDLAPAELPFLWVNHSIAQEFAPANREMCFVSGLAETEGLVFDVSSESCRPEFWECARVVVHETFHLHQLFEAKWRVPVGYDPATPPTTDDEYGQIAVQEERLLEFATLTQDDQQALEIVRRYVDLRADRHKRWPETEMLERGTEQVEGSARYVENQYSRCSGRASRLTIPPAALHTERDWLDFGRLYRSGARMLELLDRFDVRWRNRLTLGEDPYGIVCQTLV